MLNRARTVVCLVLLVAPSVFGQAKAGGQSDPELARLYDEDQNDRRKATAMTAEDWGKVALRDAARRNRVREIMRTGGLRAGEDYERAAFIFQHGEAPEDYLLAHVLAMTSVAKGNAGGRWIATATLDRFLQSIGRPQVFGTQLSSRQPLDSEFVPDSVRLDNCVPTLAGRAGMVRAIEDGNSIPFVAPCAAGTDTGLHPAPLNAGEGQGGQAVVVGKWKITAEMPDGKFSRVDLDLRDEGGKLSGTVSGDEKTIPLQNVRFDGHELTFKLTTDEGTYGVKLAFEAALKGTVTTPFGETGQAFATR